jgi:hypothetical protein
MCFKNRGHRFRDSLDRKPPLKADEKSIDVAAYFCDEVEAMDLTRRGLMSGAVAAAAGSMAAQGGEDIYRQLLRANSEMVPAAVREVQSGRPPRFGIRRIGTALQAFTAAYCAPESAHFRSAELIAPMEQAAAALLKAQHADGTIDAGNLSSPPDTGFVMETTCQSLAVLRKLDDARLDRAREQVGRFIQQAAPAELTGGVHTPNHRWVICSALARINSLFPDAKYVRRIDQWLGDGIYQDADGQYPERSTGIYSQVEDGAFVTMARLLGRPQLLEPVRRNLAMNLYYLHPNGEVETVASRRQDAGMVSNIAKYYLEYRYLAIVDGNRAFAGAAALIEEKLGAALRTANPVLSFLEEPRLREKMPEAEPVPSDYAKVFSNSGVVRIRRGPVSATVFGGSDWPLGVASGLSSTPTFFTFRKGAAILDAVRLGCNFFSEGAFHAQGVEVRDGGYVLHQRYDVPYYQPLPESERNPRGDYPLTPARDARFWSKLNFPKRQMSQVQSIDQKVTVREKAGAFELEFEITGREGVPVTVEMVFRPGGTFSGAVQEDAAAKLWTLGDGMGKYTVGGDAIEFGPGGAEHRFLNLESPSYTAHRGSVRVAGNAVYLTGYTPFRRVVRVG